MVEKVDPSKPFPIAFVLSRITEFHRLISKIAICVTQSYMDIHQMGRQTDRLSQIGIIKVEFILSPFVRCSHKLDTPWTANGVGYKKKQLENDAISTEKFHKSLNVLIRFVTYEELLFVTVCQENASNESQKIKSNSNATLFVFLIKQRKENLP